MFSVLLRGVKTLAIKAMIVLAISLLSLLVVIPVSYAAGNIPNNAYEHLPTLKEEVEEFAPGRYRPAFLAALITGESCITFRHKRCWSARSEFKTSREQGTGFFMMTRVWHRSGKIRFDTLSRLTKKYRTHLRGLNWKTIKHEPRLQIRAGIFLTNESYDAFSKDVDVVNRELFAISAHNQGLGGLKRDIKYCNYKKGCNPNRWFGHVEKIKRPGGFSRGKITGTSRSAWTINRDHVKKVSSYIPRYAKYYRGNL